MPYIYNVYFYKALPNFVCAAAESLGKLINPTEDQVTRLIKSHVKKAIGKGLGTVDIWESEKHEEYGIPTIKKGSPETRNQYYETDLSGRLVGFILVECMSSADAETQEKMRTAAMPDHLKNLQPLPYEFPNYKAKDYYYYYSFKPTTRGFREFFLLVRMNKQTGEKRYYPLLKKEELSTIQEFQLKGNMLYMWYKVPPDSWLTFKDVKTSMRQLRKGL